MHFLFGAGGTGGHLYPAIAVAEALKKINNKFRITFAGREDKIEGSKVTLFGFDFLPLDILPVSLKPNPNSIKSIVKLFIAKKKLVKFIHENNCQAVIVAGAYISLPPGLAAVSTKKPLYLMESNVNPGKAISFLTAKSKSVFTSFDESKNYFPEKLKNKIILTGNPIRSSFKSNYDKALAKSELGFDTAKPLIFVFGGSLGADSINNFVINNYPKLLEHGYQIAWQTGTKTQIKAVSDNGLKVYTYIDDIEKFYAAADLVICRSGASTVSELTLCGKPSVLIPYPSASNNEQLRNALLLQEVGAAIVVEDKDIHSNLLRIVTEQISSKEKLSKMSENAKKLAFPDAAQNIAESILKDLGYYE